MLIVLSAGTVLVVLAVLALSAGIILRAFGRGASGRGADWVPWALARRRKRMRRRQERGALAREQVERWWRLADRLRFGPVAVDSAEWKNAIRELDDIEKQYSGFSIRHR
jgi:hypothetical protein